MNDHDKPTIGITGPDKGGMAAWLFTRFSVWRVGGRALRITPSRADALPALDGLILGGGADVRPAAYGESLSDVVPDRSHAGPTRNDWLRHLGAVIFYPALFLFRKLFSVRSADPLDEARDTLELNLIEDAFDNGLPILGICRGAQLLNVYFGGTLHRDLAGFYAETPQVRSILPRKRIRVTPDSLLARVLQKTALRVNALHNQAIKATGADMNVTAREATGVVQAIEHATRPFILGVQWHPEYLVQQPEQRALFKALVFVADHLTKRISR